MTGYIGTVDPSNEDVLAEAIRSAKAIMHTAIPGKIVSYDYTTQLAVVQPVVRFRRWDEDLGQLVTYVAPTIANAPVVFPAATGYSSTWPLTAGDHGIILFQERSTDEWVATGADDCDPRDVRRFDLSDAVFIPGGRGEPVALTEVDAAAYVLAVTAAKIGSKSASEAMMLGTTYEANLDTYLTGMKTFVNGLTTAVNIAAVNALAVTFLPIATAFEAQVAAGTHRSTKLKVE